MVVLVLDQVPTKPVRRLGPECLYALIVGLQGKPIQVEDLRKSDLHLPRVIAILRWCILVPDLAIGILAKVKPWEFYLERADRFERLLVDSQEYVMFRLGSSLLLG